MYVTTKSGQKVYMPTPEEGAEITAAALSDPDAQPLTDEDLVVVARKLGRPPAEVTKELISIRLSPKVLEEFRASGDGWQTRIDAVLQHWLKRHSASQVPHV